MVAVFEVNISIPLRIASLPRTFKHASIKEECAMAMALPSQPLPRVGRAIFATQHAEAIPLATWIPEAQVLTGEVVELLVEPCSGAARSFLFWGPMAFRC